MTFPEILDAVKMLTHAEKLDLYRSLAQAVGGSFESLVAKHFPPGAVFEIPTPYDCHAAARVLEEMLEAEKVPG